MQFRPLMKPPAQLDMEAYPTFSLSRIFLLEALYLISLALFIAGHYFSGHNAKYTGLSLIIFGQILATITNIITKPLNYHILAFSHLMSVRIYLICWQSSFFLYIIALSLPVNQSIKNWFLLAFFVTLMTSITLYTMKTLSLKLDSMWHSW